MSDLIYFISYSSKTMRGEVKQLHNDLFTLLSMKKSTFLFLPYQHHVYYTLTSNNRHNINQLYSRAVLFSFGQMIRLISTGYTLNNGNFTVCGIRIYDFTGLFTEDWRIICFVLSGSQLRLGAFTSINVKAWALMVAKAVRA